MLLDCDFYGVNNAHGDIRICQHLEHVLFSMGASYDGLNRNVDLGSERPTEKKLFGIKQYLNSLFFRKMLV